MKKLICLFILTLSIISCNNDDDLSSYSNWKILNDVAYKSLTDIEFYNNDFGVISGSLGTLLKTENGGKSWSELNVGSNHSFVNVFILNENEFFTSRVGLFKTNNNGNSFNELGDLSNYSGSIFAIHFFDSDNGLIYKEGLILKTIDGGEVWDVAYNNAGYANIMQFVSSNVGYISGGISYDGNSIGEVHQSLDGGNTWNQINIQTSEITSMCFLSEQVGYFSNFENQFLKTQNGGENWEIIGSSPITFYDIVFLDNNIGYGVGNNSIYKTENGGRNWLKDYENNDMIFTSITKTPNGNLFTVSNNGMILRKQ
ncbi:WD40/YVTN/BNR-like repeat-containing protein [Yeosuana marina]|uniref:WD40/YVTN/BNR-like repeat-containing protein n=1 Tax=Yeosuana marina TaxID=1565536 RepID=UPI0030C88095